jgi:UDP-2,4-diacetamido-2,4,6-trideoxy-beta-L-altropyranose hydrolase
VAESDAQLLLIRADGSSAIGTGHVMRCIALAQAWRRAGGVVMFLQAESTESLRRRLRAEQFEPEPLPCERGSAEDADITVASAARLQAAWVVADGYCFGSDWQSRIRAAGFRLLVVDDYAHQERYDADVILNQNAGASATSYSARATESRLLLGPRYALLRAEFIGRPFTLAPITSVGRRILVTLGGSDPDNVTGTVIESVAAIPQIEITVVAGGSSPNLSNLHRLAEKHPTVRLVIDAQNMPELMAQTDVAIAAGGSTAWELAFMGVPSVLLVLADNQEPGATALNREGAAICVGRATGLDVYRLRTIAESMLSDPALRAEMRRRAQQLVDGSGAARVVTRMRAATVVVRKATSTDCKVLWDWANDPGVRQSALNSAPIDWSTHVRWFERKLLDSTTAIFIGHDATGRAIGQVRFDAADASAEIDVSVDPRRRGSGLGSALIRRATDAYLREHDAVLPTAHVKRENTASLRAFVNADFQTCGVVSHCGHDVVKLVAKK